MQERDPQIKEQLIEAAQKAASAKAARDEAIRVARREGYTLREIAEAAGLANQTIRRICQPVGATA